MASFFEKVVAQEGLICVATPRPDGGFSHRSFVSKEQAADFAASLNSTQQDAYFALGTLKDKRIWLEKENKWGVRVGANIHSFKSFFTEVDVRETKPDHYRTFDDAFQGIKLFCKKVGLPKPLIVRSGGGFHVYWPLEDDIPADDWHPVAVALKKLMQHHEFLAGRERTADRSSVLRAPGSFNWKNETPRPVQVVVDADPYPNDLIIEAIKRAAEEIGESVKEAVAPGSPTDIAAKMMKDAANIYSNYPADPKRVFMGCHQLKIVAALKGDVSEPLWYAALQICRFVQNPEKTAHRISSGHPQYDPYQTEQKLAQLEAKDIGPTTCERLESLDKAPCQGCKHKGKITSPIQLGKTIPEAEPVVMELSVTTPEGETIVEEVELPTPPKPFFRTVENQIAVLIEGGDGEPLPPKIIYQYDLYPSGRWYDEGAQREYVTWRTWLPHDGWKEFDLETAVLYDHKKLAIEIANRGVLPNIDNMKPLCHYMVTFLQKLQREQGTSRMFNQMGWRDDHSKFVIGGNCVNHLGEIAKSAISPTAHETGNGLSRKGSLENWKKLVSVYSRPGAEQMAFSFLSYAAAPLLSFTNLDGLIVSLQGESGIGKTSVMQAGNSIWGDPKRMMLNTNGSAIAIDERIAGLNTLPVSLDEITNLAKEEPRKLSDICYGISQGIGRSRLTQAGAQRPVKRWKTIMITSTNHGLHNALQLAKGNSSAEALRVFEYEVSRSAVITKQEADKTLYGLEDNHGHAGVIYAQYLITHLEEVKKRVRLAQERVDREFNVASHERYWGVLYALVQVAGEIFNELGLVEIDMATIRDWFLLKLGLLRKSLGDSEKGAQEILADFLNEHNRGIIVTTKGDGRSKIPPKVEVAPAAALVAQSIPEAGVILVSRSAFRNYCTKQGFDLKIVEEKLKDAKIIMESSVPRCLGSGTVHATAQIRCMMINSNHPEISGLSMIAPAEVDKKAKKEKTA